MVIDFNDWKILSDISLDWQHVRNWYQGMFSSQCGFEEMGEKRLLNDHFFVLNGAFITCKVPFNQWKIDKPNKLFVDLYFLDVKNRWLDFNQYETASLFMLLFSQTNNAEIFHEIGVSVLDLPLISLCDLEIYW